MTKREKAFRADLEDLLIKHRAELHITDDGKPYGMHSPVLKVEFKGYEDGGNWVDFEEFEY